MNFEEVISLINTHRGTGKKQTLARVQALMDKIGNPEKNIKAIHVAGTNGKGTTCAFLSSVLIESGVKTGIYTSPHLETIHERIKINEDMISTENLIQYTEKIAPFVQEIEENRQEKMYSFEILTAVAFLYFAEQKCDIVVLETGMGGKFDATNTITSPIVSIITSIGKDHMYKLGNTIEEIAAHKAGIIKKGIPVIVYPMEDNILSVIRDKASTVDAPMNLVEKQDVILKKQNVNKQTFDYKLFTNVSMEMIGEHQLYNTALAIEGLIEVQKAGYPVTNEDIIQGIDKAKWAGRMEKISDEPLVFIDGAHNVPGVEALSKNIDSLFPNETVTFFIGIMKDKEFMKMINLVEDKASKMYILSPDEGKGFDPYEVAQNLKKAGYPAQARESIEDIAYYIEHVSEKDEKIIVFGSLYLVGDLRKAMIGGKKPIV